MSRDARICKQKSTRFSHVPGERATILKRDCRLNSWNSCMCCNECSFLYRFVPSAVTHAVTVFQIALGAGPQLAYSTAEVDAA